MVKPHVTIKEKIHDVNEKAKKKAGDAVIWMAEHKELTATMIPIFLGLGSGIVKTVSQKMKRNEERELKEEYIYDRRAGHYVRVRRQPTNSEWILIDRRYQSGDNYTDILNDMRLLK